MFTTHGHWYPPAREGERPPNLIARCGGPGLCQQCAVEVHLVTPQLVPVSLLPEVLNSQAPPAPSLPLAGASSPVQVSIDGIRDWYFRFLELKDAAKKIEDALEEARSMILDSVKSRHAELPAKTNLTIDGRPVLQLQKVSQNRVDTKRLRTERPDLAKEFNVESNQERLNIL